MASKPVRVVTNPTINSIAHLVSLLLQGTRTLPELASETGLNINTVQRYCAALYRAKAMHIADWRKDGRGAFTIRVYRLGANEDAVAHVVSRAEKAKRYRHAQAELRLLEANKTRRGEFDYLGFFGQLTRVRA